MKKLTIFAGLVLAACTACAEAMEPIVPVVWRRGAVEETANDLKAIARLKFGGTVRLADGGNFKTVDHNAANAISAPRHLPQ